MGSLRSDTFAPKVLKYPTHHGAARCCIFFMRGLEHEADRSILRVFVSIIAVVNIDAIMMRGETRALDSASRASLHLLLAREARTPLGAEICHL